MYFYGDFSDNDSYIYEDGIQDAYMDDQFAFDYISNNDSYDKEWLLRYDLFLCMFNFLYIKSIILIEFLGSVDYILNHSVMQMEP